MNPNPLTDADFDRLEELLEAEVFAEEAMRLDEAQALICAVVSSPEPIQPAVWLPEVLGSGVDKVDDPVKQNRFVQVLQSVLCNNIICEFYSHFISKTDILKGEEKHLELMSNVK